MIGALASTVRDSYRASRKSFVGPTQRQTWTALGLGFAVTVSRKPLPASITHECLRDVVNVALAVEQRLVGDSHQQSDGRFHCGREHHAVRQSLGFHRTAVVQEVNPVLHVPILRAKTDEVVLPWNTFPYLRLERQREYLARAELRLGDERPLPLWFRLRKIDSESRPRQSRRERDCGENETQEVHGGRVFEKAGCRATAASTQR